MPEGGRDDWARVPGGSARIVGFDNALLGVLRLEPRLPLGCQCGFQRLAEYVQPAFEPNPLGFFGVRGPGPAPLPEESVLALRLARTEQVGELRPQHGCVAEGQEAAELAIEKVIELGAHLRLVLAKPASAPLGARARFN